MAKKNKPVEGVSLVTVVDKNAILAEQCRMIRSNIQFSAVDQEIRSLVITSSGMSEGKSTISANLAVVFADSGKRVLLVDADLRRPTVALTFKKWNHEGLSTVLSDRQADLDAIIQESGVENLDLLTSGPKPPNPSEMLGSQRMAEIMDELEAMYDYVIYDLPPVSNITDAQILAAKADATVMVARESQTNKQDFLQAVKQLKIAKANLIGVIYNGMNTSRDSYYYYGG